MPTFAFLLQVKLGKSEAERLKVERKKERDELLGKLEATNQYIALKTKKLEYIAMKMSEEEAGNKFNVTDRPAYGQTE